jgi:elongation factor 1-beta
MPNLLVRVKIMPKEAEIKPPEVLESIKQKNGEIVVRSSREEPIAFGLVALIADFVTDDRAGAMEEIENAIRKSELVGEFEVLGASRISADVKRT